MTEANFQTKFTRWAKYNLQTAAACELKLTKGKSLPFSAVQEHQKIALGIVKHGWLGYKIPDCGLSQKPFDFISLSGEAFVVVMFYKRGQKKFYMIDIDVWCREEETSQRESLTEERAEEIGKRCLLV